MYLVLLYKKLLLLHVFINLYNIYIYIYGKEIKQVNGFVYLGGMVTEDGHSEVEVRRRIQAGR